MKDLATGAISLQVTEQYRIDRTQPTGEIRVDERTVWQSFLSRITFDLFYREEQTVVITSADETSGRAATEYLLSAEDLDIPALEQETFLPYEKALALAPDGEYVVYARITDRRATSPASVPTAWCWTPRPPPSPGLKTAACTAPQ